MTQIEVLTVGHSTHTWDKFSRLLKNAAVTAIADVRSFPFSKFSPHFSQPELKQTLREEGIAYAFLGKELGGRPQDPALFIGGVANYEAMARTASFTRGLERVLDGAIRFRIALMCSEHDPLDCHRCLLVGRHLALRGATVKHILLNGKIVSHESIENRMLEITKLSESDLFDAKSERLSAAYRERNQQVGYSEATDDFRPEG